MMETSVDISDIKELAKAINGIVADTNPEHFAMKTKEGYGRWQFNNGYNMGIMKAVSVINSFIKALEGETP